MNCRFCARPLHHVFLDLGSSPPSNAFLSHEALGAPETYFPLRLYTCHSCFLVQVDEVQAHTALFSDDYVYFSSVSRSWLSHAERYVEKAVGRLGLSERSLVMEIASNDGYLLQYVAARGVPCVGVEPTAGTAEAAKAKGIETLVRFFGRQFAREFAKTRGRADLIVANNVLAHVPDLNDFVGGFACALAPQGTITLEFPHLMELIAQRQFDTVYHEHFSYFSLHTVRAVFAAHGLRIWDVEQLATHGGSLRVWACHENAPLMETPAVVALLAAESSAGMLQLPYYTGFQEHADQVKNDLLRFLLDQKRLQQKVVGYGAAAKGNTLLNYAGVRADLLPYVADASPRKQGRYLPGSRIPVVAEERLHADKPDVVLILPWNLRREITEQLAYIRDWGACFAIAVPRMEVA